MKTKRFLKKYGGILGVLLLAYAVSAPGLSRSGLQRGIQPADFQNLTETYTDGIRTVSDAIPRVCVIFWDGRANAWGANNAAEATAGATDQIQAFLRRGLDIGMGLNSANIDGAGDLTWTELRAIQAYAAANNANVDMFSHSNNNMPTADFYAAGDNFQTIIDEFDPVMIEDSLGVDVKLFAVPGDSGRREWVSYNYDVYKSILKDHGYDYAFFWGGAQTANPGGVAWFRDAEFQAVTSHSDGTNSFPIANLSKPGSNSDPYNIAAGAAIADQGITVVERDGLGAGRNLDSTADDWTIHGDGASGRTYYNKTAAFGYSSALSANAGFVVSIHDSQTTDTATMSWGGTSAGHFSPEHIASTLKALEDAGHIVVVTPTEWSKWAMSKYAPGTDLISNPGIATPQFDIGDTVGDVSEYFFPRGVSAHYANRGAFDATLWGSNLWLSQGGGAGDGWRPHDTATIAAFDPSTGYTPFGACGDSVDGWRGQPGAAQVYDGGASPTGRTRYMNLLYLDIPPGRYRWSISVYNPEGGNWTIRNFTLGATLKGFRPETTWEAQGAATYGDTVVIYRHDATGATVTTNAARDDEWTDYSLEFFVPESPIGDAMATTVFSQPTGTLLDKTGGSMWLDNIHWAMGMSVDWIPPATGTRSVYLSRPSLVYVGPR